MRRNGEGIYEKLAEKRDVNPLSAVARNRVFFHQFTGWSEKCIFQHSSPSFLNKHYNRLKELRHCEKR
ncbi:hypothetical protein SAMN05421736_10642 [Evansella caseinilytica]|uniref:Uncharacterized protein n=1 Tax=Evansella caseinilytica TaxID=1503961 RepID=A0A1H3Q7D4_9BACI|nr:hypothetical protein SAMN05421736_10642 [Evansella caseinilytica]